LSNPLGARAGRFRFREFEVMGPAALRSREPEQGGEHVEYGQKLFRVAKG